MFYKVLVIAAFVLMGYSDAKERILVFPKETAAAIKDVTTKCASKPEDVLEFYSLHEKRGGYKEDENFKELVHCAYKNSGFAHEDGRINQEAAAKVFPDDSELLQAIKDCVKIGESAKETTFLSFKCFQDTSNVLIKL